MNKHLRAVRERWSGLRQQWHPEKCRHENYVRPRKSDYEEFQVVTMNPSEVKKNRVSTEESIRMKDKIKACSKCTKILRIGEDYISCASSKADISLNDGRCPLWKWPSSNRTVKKNKLRIFQIYFSQESKKNLEPELFPYYNNNCTKYFENSVIRTLIESREHVNQDYFGVFSHNFRLKLKNWDHSRSYDQYEELENYVLGSGADVISVLNTNDNHDPIEIGDWWHPNFSRVMKMVLNKVGFKYQRKALKHSLYCNCFVATPHFWESYCTELLFPAIDVMEKAEGELWHRLNSNSNYAPLAKNLQEKFGLKYYPYHPFICERLPNIYLMKYPQYKVLAW
ncbi:MAG: hypothetical protein AAGC72_03950 [Planctomycetota bacterium]